MIAFFAQGEPKGQPRPRAFAMRMGNGKFSARVFDAGTAENWKSCVAIAAKPHQRHDGLEGPKFVMLEFVFARPKSHFRSIKGQLQLKDNAPKFYTAKPDVDNLAKAVLDCLTQIGGFWRDDSQIVSVLIMKRYALDGDKSGCWIAINDDGVA